MRLRFYLYIVIVLLNINSLFAQNSLLELRIENKHTITGIDYKTKNYLVFNGFDSFYKKSFTSEKWEIVPYKFNELPKTANYPYIFFHIKGKNYLVHSSCGAVYEFSNDAIKRIDNSFVHQNQNYASCFVYKDEIYFFGGYGLFTFKNILTKYDFKTNEWDLVRYNDYDNIPQPRSEADFFLINDDLYILSGLSENYDSETNSIKHEYLKDIWKLNLKTRIWEYIGELKDSSLIGYGNEKYNVFQNEKSNFMVRNYLFQIDFEKNSVNYYQKESKFLFSDYVKYNLQKNEILYVLANSSSSKKDVRIIVEPFDEYRGSIIKTDVLYKQGNYRYLHFLWLMILIFPLIYFKKQKNKTEVRNCITQKESEFIHKNKALTNLTLDEKELLNYFFEKYNTPIQMNDVVDFVAKDDTSNYNSLTKKKDIILNVLKQKLSFILEINEEEIFVYSKNNEDKRIKEVKLNTKYFVKT
jgi:hypothetical protein